MINLDKFFNPQSVAIIGVSRDPKKIGHIILRNLISGLYKGKVFLVNPNAEKILNFTVYSNIKKINEEIDLAVISVPAEYVLQALKDCHSKKIKNVIIITAGFKEIGNEKEEKKILDFADKSKINIIGVNCLGTFDAYTGFDSLFLPKYKLKRPSQGGISFVSQSGAAASAILDIAAEQGFKFSKFISYGNATQIDESDIIEYLGKDESTKVIYLYIEGAKYGKKLLSTLKQVGKRKPIIVMKAGISEAGSKATLSHTGSLAGSSEVYKGVLQQAGVIHAETLENVLDYAEMFEKYQKVKGNRVQVITNGGGYGVIATDAISLSKNLKMAELSKDTQKKLRKIFPEKINISNPLDLVGDATTEYYKIALENTINDNNIDIIFLIVLHQTPLITPDIVDVIVEANKQTDKPIIVVSTGAEFTENLRRVLEKENMVTYPFPERAAKALDALVEFNNKD
jgi:acetyl coenzyme A synthetase (ADP forming)-like protein